MTGGTPGPKGASGHREAVKDGRTSALMATPPPVVLGITYDMDDRLSYELADAPPVCVPTSLRHLSLAEMRTIAWLRKYKGEIIAAEGRFSIDRRAIAGAIAWEALKNDTRWTNFGHRVGVGRSVGPGKVHIASGIVFGGESSTWSFQVEKRGLLPQQGESDRKALLGTAAGAIDYIAASMDLIAMIYEDAGSPGLCSPEIRMNPWILTNEYQGSDPDKWTGRVKTIQPREKLLPGNKMSLWLEVPRNMTLVEDAVENPAGALANNAGKRDNTNRKGTRPLHAPPANLKRD